jgi:zinc/manganese transport system substrate-binding protein
MSRSPRTTERAAVRTRRGGPRSIALTGVLALVLAACSGADEPAAAPAPPQPSTPAVAPVNVVATTSILGDLVQNLLGADGTVRVLIGPGVDPHGYEASAADAAAMRDADLVVANGLLLEEGLTSALAAALADGVRIITVADQVDPIPFGSSSHSDHDDDGDDHGHGHGHSHSHGHDHGHDHGKNDDHGHDEDHDEHDHGDEDPHFWWDPMRTAVAVDLIAAELASIRPEIDWSVRAAAYNAELMLVHEEMVALFATIPAERRSIITNHDSLGYLAAAYGFEVIGTVIPGSSTMAATNPRAFARLVDLVISEGVDVIFAENTDTTVLAEQLRSEAVGRGDVEVRVVRLFTDALGGPGSGAETYLTMLRTTATAITQALTRA